MADLLVRHLKEKAGDHSALERLVHQWGFDEKLIPKALQTIGHLFPHYSSHDESHSKQILVNIERLLGQENISKLTAIDTWLLLEAAYWHDIGMVVPQKDIIDAFEEPDFRLYLASIKNSPKHELNRFCLSFDAQDINKCFNGADTPIEAIDKLQQLMAEWFRRKHASRAAEIINAPWKTIGLSSPRTELIPTRLFMLLGRVCHMHGLPFQEIIGPNGLPYREAGLAQEDCHPRFVACLLRMGDLLDIDDNRFCPVMKRIAGDNRPELSKAHEDKHASIRHLRVDRERIEVSADCETIDGYLETYKWFDWLKQEIQNQMAHWLDIVPSREFGLLPTLGVIQVNLKGNQQLLAEGQRPQFSIDGEQATALLQGSNLYSSKFACIRELLQNSTDATLLKLWITKKIKKTRSKGPLDLSVSKILEDNPINVTLKEDYKTETPDDKTAWTLTISDQGTGISRNDLQHMLKIGGSKKNIFRQEKISQMPEWLKPSGTFGIGLQSIFMIAESVKFTTKDIFTNESKEITMHNPTGSKEGLVTIKNLNSDFCTLSGSKIDVSFLLEKKSLSWNYGLNNNQISRALAVHFDPLLDESFPFEAAELADKIIEFSSGSMLPITGNFIANNLVFNFHATDEQKTSNLKFMEVSGQQLLIGYSPNPSISRPRGVHTLAYRGQKIIVSQGIDLPKYLNIHVNLLSGEAGKWITFSRDNILEAAEEKLKQLINDALKKSISEDLKDLKFLAKLTLPSKRAFSFYMKLCSIKDKSWPDMPNELRDDWRSYSFGVEDKESYNKLAKKTRWILSKRHRHPIRPNVMEKHLEEKCEILITDRNRYPEDIKTVYLSEWLNQANHSIKVLESSHYHKGRKQLRYQMSKKPQKLYNKKSLATVLAIALRDGSSNRRYLLCLETAQSKKLRLKPNDLINEIPHLFDVPSNNYESVVLLPFRFSYQIHQSDALGINFSVSATSLELEKLSKWITPHLKEEVTPEEIRKKYDELVLYIDNEIMRPSVFWEEWRQARGIEAEPNEPIN